MSFRLYKLFIAKMHSPVGGAQNSQRKLLLTQAKPLKNYFRRYDILSILNGLLRFFANRETIWHMFSQVGHKGRIDCDTVGDPWRSVNYTSDASRPESGIWYEGACSLGQCHHEFSCPARLNLACSISTLI